MLQKILLISSYQLLLQYVIRNFLMLKILKFVYSFSKKNQCAVILLSNKI